MRANGRSNSQTFLQRCANECNNSLQCWVLECIVGRIQPIRLWRPWVTMCRTMCIARARGPSNVGRAAQMDPTLLRYVSVITEQKKCWESLTQQFDRFQTLHNNSKQHATTCNRMRQRTQHAAFNNVASVCTGLYLPAS